MTDELIDIIDEHNKLTGETIMKSVAHAKGIWHRGAHIFIYNNQGEVLMQLRVKDKEMWPAVWDISAAGHVSAGEKVITSALREMSEEVGINVSENDLELFDTRKEEVIFKDMISKEWIYSYLYCFNGDISNLKLQEEEVEEIKFIPIDSLKKDIKKNSENYAPRGSYWFDMINEIKKRLV